MGNRDPNADTVFLVSGGAKGITAACVVALARRFQSKFILVGRSPFNDGVEPDWAFGRDGGAALMEGAMAHLQSQGEQLTPRALKSMVLAVQSQREIATTLDAVRKAGGDAIYEATDVTKRDDLQTAVKKGERRFGPISGVVHGAGVLADKLVQHKAMTDFERVVSVKADGLWNLISCIPEEQLEMLVLFSSVAGFYGNVGQVDYALANEVLNKAAYWVRRHLPQCRVLAIDWGPWDGGMVTPALRAQLVSRNIALISVNEGTGLLTDMVDGTVGGPGVDTPQVVVGGAMVTPRPVPPAARTYRLRRRLSLAANPFLADHVIGGSAVLPTVCAASWMINACEQVTPGYRYKRIDRYQALKGIVFDDALAESYMLELKAAPPASYAGDTVTYDALIFSQTRGGRPRYHYRARVTLGPSGPTVVRDIPVARDPVMTGADLYGGNVLFHGPSFQGIESVLSMDEGGLTMQCRQPRLSHEMQGQFPVQTFNPFAMDVQLQSLLVWARHFVGYGGLPLGIAAGIGYQPIRFGMPTYVTMKVRICTAHRLVADVSVIDETGRLCMEVVGAEITLSERLNDYFARNRLPTELPTPAG